DQIGLKLSAGYYIDNDNRLPRVRVDSFRFYPKEKEVIKVGLDAKFYTFPYNSYLNFYIFSGIVYRSGIANGEQAHYSTINNSYLREKKTHRASAITASMNIGFRAEFYKNVYLDLCIGAGITKDISGAPEA